MKTGGGDGGEDGWWRRGVETGGGDRCRGGSETGSVTKNANNNRLLVSVPGTPRT